LGDAEVEHQGVAWRGREASEGLSTYQHNASKVVDRRDLVRTETGRTLSIPLTPFIIHYYYHSSFIRAHIRLSVLRQDDNGPPPDTKQSHQFDESQKRAGNNNTMLILTLLLFSL
jgi:hypothetical protein